jgi:nitroimidazol reductase NimA-like FMN-containing flavoprotein (pyridoxamine 5'-phosphate oxidase superfamily)
MFREMRRKKQILSIEETREIFNSCTSGVLAVSGDDDYPYAVPLSYSFEDDKIFFHCAKTGHKIDGIKRNDKVTFTVIDRDDIIQETFTTHFRSATAFGRARILTEDKERREALQSLIKKYSPDYIKEGEKEIDGDWNVVCVVEVKIEHMTGKAAIEIVNDRKI